MYPARVSLRIPSFTSLIYGNYRRYNQSERNGDYERKRNYG